MITNKDLANLMYPNITKSPCDYEKKYPERKLPEGAVVSRFAPSPTGFVHMGSLLTALVAAKVPKDTRGIFFLRIEDTDGKRKVENGIQGIIDDLVNFDIQIDEGVVSESEEKGKYGPYVQTRRKEIYDTYAKYMIENDLAYPCFCTEKELENIRDRQEKNKESTTNNNNKNNNTSNNTTCNNNTNFKTAINRVSLSPLKTRYTDLDEKVASIISSVTNSGISNYEKLQAIYIMLKIN